MKATLDFNMDDADERMRFKFTINAINLHAALYDFKEYMNHKLKNEALSEEQHHSYALVYEKFKAIVQDNGVGELV